MQVTVINESGYEEALYGLSLSFKDRATNYSEWWTSERYEKMKALSFKMFNKDGGHNKFLESMVVWIDIEAPRGWWQEFDTYRVGTTKQSESTMHTIQKRPVTLDDFEECTHLSMVVAFNEILRDVTENFSNTKPLHDTDLERIKNSLPEGYLQRRVVCLNYKVLRNMITQRSTHRLRYWKDFIREVRNQVKYPTLLEIKDVRNRD